MTAEPLTAPAYMPCEACGTEGRIFKPAPTYWEPYNERDCGPCPCCNGTGEEMVEDCEVSGEPEPFEGRSTISPARPADPVAMGGADG